MVKERQYLFNSFSVEVADVVVASTFDPFHKNMSQDQIENWLLNHVVFNESGSIIAVFNENTILWKILMVDKPKHSIEDADIIMPLRNFSGKERRYNKEGDHVTYNQLPEDLANTMLADGWNVSISNLMK
jgi:hypothetical protein